MSIEKGTLVRWMDEKGFGFITPENGKNDIFIPI
jgi:cold shock CspA family protein